jgi:mannitol/fructose-specific phosphotransferase system IIA component (Ntr-type)
MLITDYLSQNCITTSLTGSNKQEIINNLAELIFQQFPEIDKNEALEGIWEREKLMSTGIGEGVAIPHARIDSSPEIVTALGLLPEQINFDSLDDKPVKLVVLILFPKEEVNLQLKYLARVSRLLQRTSLHDDLFQCHSAEEVLKAIKKFEETHVH